MVDTTTTTASWPTKQQESCSSRLPCGVCLILGKMCPKVEQTFTPTWNINTAQANQFSEYLETGGWPTGKES